MLEGIIYQINAKPENPNEGGMPKTKVEVVQITRDGLFGDHNNYRIKEFKKDQENPLRVEEYHNKAILIMPLEMIQLIEKMVGEMKPGWMGENFTTEGIPYNRLSRGQMYRLGNSVEIELTKPATPCGNLKIYEAIKNNWPRSKEDLKGRRGWYAKVLREGIVKEGDRIILIN